MTLITAAGAGHFQAGSYAGRNLHFGIREHAMAAACNGLALSGLRPYCGTFFVFTDYMRPSMRLASLMRQGVIYVLTHDSIGLGEDGPTHQPVEQLAACRAIPRLLVFRPADANEVAESYRAALQPSASAVGAGPHAAECAHAGPVAMCRGRRRGPRRLRAAGSARGQRRRSFCWGRAVKSASAWPRRKSWPPRGSRRGSSACPASSCLTRRRPRIATAVLPPAITARVGVEAGIVQGWEKYLGPQGRFVGMHDFGASGPFEELYEHFGITAEAVVEQAKAIVQCADRALPADIRRARAAQTSSASAKTIVQTASTTLLIISRGRLGDRGLAGSWLSPWVWSRWWMSSPCYSDLRDLEVPIKGLVELVHVVEVLAAVGLRFLHQADVDQIVDDFAEVAGAGNAPVVEHDARHQAELLDRIHADGLAQLLAGEVRFGLRIVRLGGLCGLPHAQFIVGVGQGVAHELVGLQLVTRIPLEQLKDRMLLSGHSACPS